MRLRAHLPLVLVSGLVAAVLTCVGVLLGPLEVLSGATALLLFGGCWSLFRFLRPRPLPSSDSIPHQRREVRGQVLFSSWGDDGLVRLDCVGESPLGPFTLELSSPLDASTFPHGPLALQVGTWVASDESTLVTVAVVSGRLRAQVQHAGLEASFTVERVRGLSLVL